MSNTTSIAKMMGSGAVCKLTLLPGLIISYLVGIVSGEGQVLDIALSSYADSVEQCEASAVLITHHQPSGQFE